MVCVDCSNGRMCSNNRMSQINTPTSCGYTSSGDAGDCGAAADSVDVSTRDLSPQQVSLSRSLNNIEYFGP